jgi:hypothetical protein
MLAALIQASPAGSAAEMRRHLDELEQSLRPQEAAPRALRDVFAAYREPGRARTATRTAAASAGPDPEPEPALTRRRAAARAR